MEVTEQDAAAAQDLIGQFRVVLGSFAFQPHCEPHPAIRIQQNAVGEVLVHEPALDPGAHAPLGVRIATLLQYPPQLRHQGSAGANSRRIPKPLLPPLGHLPGFYFADGGELVTNLGFDGRALALQIPVRRYADATGERDEYQ